MTITLGIISALVALVTMVFAIFGDTRMDALQTESRSEIRRIDQHVAAIERGRGPQEVEAQQPKRDNEQKAAD